MALENGASGQDVINEINKKLDIQNNTIKVNHICDSNGNVMFSKQPGGAVTGEIENTSVPVGFITAGAYTGSGDMSGETHTKISLGFTPKWVLIFPESFSTDVYNNTGYEVLGGMALITTGYGQSAWYSNYRGGETAWITEGGFEVSLFLNSKAAHKYVAGA